MRERKTLWTKDFTIITLGTVISAIGGTAMNLALGLVVFDNTGSSWLTGLFSAVSMLPALLLPVLMAPYLDNHSRKKAIVCLDCAMGLLYLVFGAYVHFAGFSYISYLFFGLLSGSIGAVYSTAYSALYPDLIPDGFMQKGYSVSSLSNGHRRGFAPGSHPVCQAGYQIPLLRRRRSAVGRQPV